MTSYLSFNGVSSVSLAHLSSTLLLSLFQYIPRAFHMLYDSSDFLVSYIQASSLLYTTPYIQLAGLALMLCIRKLSM